MKSKLLIVSAILSALAAPAGAFADELTSGVQSGASEGARSGGPVGAVLGGVAGGVIGGVSGTWHVLTGAPGQSYSLQQYVRSNGIQSHSFAGQVQPGMRVPKGIAMYRVPAQLGDSRLLFTVVNNEIVLVHPRSRRLLQIVSPA